MGDAGHHLSDRSETIEMGHLARQRVVLAAIVKCENDAAVRGARDRTSRPIDPARFEDQGAGGRGSEQLAPIAHTKRIEERVAPRKLRQNLLGGVVGVECLSRAVGHHGRNVYRVDQCLGGLDVRQRLLK